ncbi:MAG: hypothetical protein ABI919_01640 [Ramlibacter sp.]
MDGHRPLRDARDALGGGVTRSLALDAHGKTLGIVILDVVLDDAPADLA